MKITTDLSQKSLTKAIKDLKRYKKWIETNCKELAYRLAVLGATNVTFGFARAIYTGPKDVQVYVEETPGGYTIVADGESVAFIEFGAGVTYGDGHPQNAQFGTGPGTFPGGKGHWNDPNGWWLPQNKGGEHTYGNPPNAVMYQTAEDLRNEIYRIAKEVFR